MAKSLIEVLEEFFQQNGYSKGRSNALANELDDRLLAYGYEVVLNQVE